MADLAMLAPWLGRRRRGAARAHLRGRRGSGPPPRRPGTPRPGAMREVVPAGLPWGSLLAATDRRRRLRSGRHTPHAARMARFARAGLGAVLTTPCGTPTATPRSSTFSTPRAVGRPRSATHRSRERRGFLKSTSRSRIAGDRAAVRVGDADTEPIAARPDPAGRRPLCPRPAGRPRAGEVRFPGLSAGELARGARRRLRSDRPGPERQRRWATRLETRCGMGGLPTRCCVLAARGRSAVATARPRGSASGSGSTTSWR